jgi:hypothetical protein
MDNSGQRPLSVPGFGGRSLYEELGVDDRFADAVSGWEQRPALTAPEMAMLQLMSDLTDKRDWNIDVFNDDIVAKWREETFKAQEDAEVRMALRMRLISGRAWGWCIMELRDKASMFEEDKLIRLFDAGSAVCKSDALVSDCLRLALKDGIAPMLKKSYSDQDQMLVDPSLFPLVFGKTSVLMEGRVGLRDGFKLIGSGKPAPKQLDERMDTSGVELRIKEGDAVVFCTNELDELKRFYWSSNFQLLPCEVEVDKSGTDAHITSYINNLHPLRHKSMYDSIEKLISLAIKPWNECLVRGEKGRWPIRIRTYGLTWEPEYPQSSIIDGLYQGCETNAYKEAMKEAEQFLKLPNRGSNQPTDLPEGWDKHFHTEWHVNAKWKNAYKLHHPEPDMSFSYNDWKDGRNGAAIKGKWGGYETESVIIRPDPDHEFYSVKLEDTFRDQGLQVIVKIGSIEPSYTNGWHMDTLNEHIVATAMYFFDVENTTETRISFRQRTYAGEEDYNYNRGNGALQPSEFEVDVVDIEAMLGFKPTHSCSIPPMQEVGSISAPQGRLITWPSTLQHRIEPVTLINATIPGHRRFVMLSLVDPHYRVCSTRNVPPQGHVWWSEEVHGILTSRGIPLEVAELITDMADSWPVGIDEARRDQEHLMRERKWAEEAFTESLGWVIFGEQY